MDRFQRESVATLVSRLEEPPNRLIAVFGPRQTGKTTMVHQALAQTDRPNQYLAVDEPAPSAPGISVVAPIEDTAPLAEERDSAWLVRTWEHARQRAQESPQGFVLVFDEIQKIPDWSATIKGLWDADRARSVPLHVVVLGSAPLPMQSGLSESLAGRFEPIRITHWAFPEMSAAFDVTLDEYLYFGGYPGAATLIRDEERWRDYILHALVEPHLERDLLAMTRVDKPALLKNLFELGAAYSGQVLSYNKMLGQLLDAGNTTTLARYLQLLSTAGLLTGLPKHSESSQRRRASSPKLNVLNTALMTAASGYSVGARGSTRNRPRETRRWATLCGVPTGGPSAEAPASNWPDLDEGISVDGLLAGRPSAESQESFQRWLEAKRARLPRGVRPPASASRQSPRLGSGWARVSPSRG